nr:MAG TPA: hypothetical protein [Caudoviricetes sp.]
MQLTTSEPQHTAGTKQAEIYYDESYYDVDVQPDAASALQQSFDLAIGR